MEIIDEIKQAYRRTFENPMGGTVLADLAEYCNFLSTTVGNPYEEAKRDVFLHVLEMYGDASVVDVITAIQAIPNRNKESQYEADR
jgi:hypothetical protein